MSEREKRYVSVVEASTLLGLSVDTVRRMVESGRLEHFRTSQKGAIRIKLDERGYPVVR